MTLNQSYDESTYTSVQSYNVNAQTNQWNNFANTNTIQGTANIKSLVNDDQSCHSVNKIDHSIDLRQANETNSKTKIAAFDYDSIT